MFVAVAIASIYAIQVGVPEPRPVVPIEERTRLTRIEADELASEAENSKDLAASASYGYGYYGAYPYSHSYYGYGYGHGYPYRYNYYYYPYYRAHRPYYGRAYY